jgi:hypothetical protein
MPNESSTGFSNFCPPFDFNRFQDNTFPLNGRKHPSGAKEAAEKGLKSGRNPEKHPAGAKAQHLLSSICGTAEAVP